MNIVLDGPAARAENGSFWVVAEHSVPLFGVHSRTPIGTRRSHVSFLHICPTRSCQPSPCAAMLNIFWPLGCALLRQWRSSSSLVCGACHSAAPHSVLPPSRKILRGTAQPLSVDGGGPTFTNADRIPCRQANANACGVQSGLRRARSRFSYVTPTREVGRRKLILHPRRCLGALSVLDRRTLQGDDSPSRILQDCDL